MIRKLLGTLGAGFVLGLAPAAAQEPAATSSFDIQIHAPPQVQALLERHLELYRYREVSDLDDAELARLVVVTEREVRELVGTLGYFSPEVRIAREPGARPVISIAVDPGKPTRVADAKIDFDGDIARSADPDAVLQRDEIRDSWTLPPGN